MIPNSSFQVNQRSARLPARMAMCIAAFCINTPALAELPDWAPKPKPQVVEDRFRAEVSVLGASFDTTFRVDQSRMVRGTTINAEDDLGLDDFDPMVLAEITLLPGENQLFRLSGQSMRRTGRKFLNRAIVFDEDSFRVNELVDSKLDLTLFGLTYGYRFINSERAEMAATFGIQIGEFDANAVARSRTSREPEDGVAPLPLVGVEGRYSFLNRWSGEARFQYVRAITEDIRGSIFDGRVGITWRQNPYLVYGLGYRKFFIKVNSNDDDTPGRIDLEFKGPMLYLRASL